MEGNAGYPLEAEYDEDLRVVSASRVLSPEEYSDPSAREAAERDARAAVEAEMARRGCDYADLPVRGWLRVEPLSGGPPHAHHFEFRARVRAAQDGG